MCLLLLLAIIMSEELLLHLFMFYSCIKHLRIDLAQMPLLGNVVIQKNPTIMQDLSRRCIATRQESVSMYPHRPKAEAFSNAVDVVERLHDPTDPSTERTAPPCSAHVQLDDVPRALDPVEGQGRVPLARRRGDGVDDATGAGLRLRTPTI